jgi:hypothetical protein
MKSFIAFAAVLACAVAKPGVLTYNAAFPYSAAAIAHPAYGYSAAAAPIAYTAAPAISYAHAPAAITYAAPAIAPAVIAPAFTKTQYHAQDELGQASFGHAHAGQSHAAVRDAAGNVQGAYAYINPEGQEIRVAYTAGHGGFQVASNALPVAPVHVAEVPAPVADTPEVVEARAAHFQAVNEAKARNAAAGPEEPEQRSERKKRGAVYAAAVAAPVLTAAIPVATSSTYRYDAPRINALRTYTAVAAAPALRAYSPALYGYGYGHAYAAPYGYGYSTIY